MKMPGNRNIAFALGLGTTLACVVFFQSCKAGDWAAAGSMGIARFGHSATLLQNGKVLAAGGGYDAGYFSSAELYNPTTRTWEVAGSMADNRVFHTATLLPSGMVLVAGGLTSVGIRNHSSSVSELYDPTTGTWKETSAMATARYHHTATLLPNGNVLVTGGINDGSVVSNSELYDPITGKWKPAGIMAIPRSQHTATLLLNGKVLIAGGVGLVSAELYDPVSGTWEATGSMTISRRIHTATLLSNGKVLVAGGYAGGSGTSIHSSSEVYDPSSGKWTAVGAMAMERSGHTATLLPDGKVLVAGGGQAASAFTASAELYQPGTGTWGGAEIMGAARVEHSATLLTNGGVLVVGGRNRIGNSVEAISSTELYFRSGTTASTAKLGNVRITREPDSRSRLDFSGVSGQSYIIEASSDFINWEKIGVAIERTSGNFTFDDENAPDARARLYRVAIP